MRKNHFSKAIALLVCLSFLAVAVPGLNSMEKRSAKVDARMFLKKPMAFFSSILPAIGSMFDSGASMTKSSIGSKKPKVKPLDDIVIPRP